MNVGEKVNLTIINEKGRSKRKAGTSEENTAVRQLNYSEEFSQFKCFRN